MAPRRCLLREEAGAKKSEQTNGDEALLFYPIKTNDQRARRSVGSDKMRRKPQVLFSSKSRNRTEGVQSSAGVFVVSKGRKRRIFTSHRGGAPSHQCSGSTRAQGCLAHHPGAHPRWEHRNMIQMTIKPQGSDHEPNCVWGCADLGLGEGGHNMPSNLDRVTRSKTRDIQVLWRTGAIL